METFFMSAHPLPQPKHSSLNEGLSSSATGRSCRDDFFEVSLGDTFTLCLGGALKDARVSARLTGADDAPIVAVMGGISADRFVSDHPLGKGWWRDLVGDGKAIDLNKHRVLSFNFLTPKSASSSEPYSVSTRDQARVLAAILKDRKIEKLHAIVGSSYGAMAALTFGALYPEQVGRLVAISGAHRSHPMTTALRSIQRKIVKLALGGEQQQEALALARQLAMTTYRSWDEFGERFSSTPAKAADGYHFPVEDYLQARGDDFASKVDAEDFLALSESLDLHDVDPSQIKVPATFVAVRQDLLVPLSDMRDLSELYGGEAELVEIESYYGHDAFLKEVDVIGAILRHNLSCEGADA